MGRSQLNLGLRPRGGPSLPAAWLANQALLWLDPDIGLVSAGGLVSQITDRSPNKNHATASGGDRPATDTINGHPAYLLDGGAHNVPTLGTAISTARAIFMVYDRTGLASPPVLSPILGSNASLFDFAAGSSAPDMFDGTHTSIALESVSQGGTAEVRINGDWSEVWNEASTGFGPIQKPSGPSVITLLAGAGVHFNNLGMDRITSRVDHSRRRDLVALSFVPSPATVVSIENYLMAKSGITPSLPSRAVVFSGDSLTAGNGATVGNDAPTLTIALLNTPSLWKGNGAYVAFKTRAFNAGVGGTTNTDLLALDPVNVYRKLSRYHAVNAVILGGGTNDLARQGLTPAQAVAAKVALYQQTVAACPGVFVGATTVVTRSDFGAGTPSNFYALAASFNSLLAAALPTGAIVDWASHPNLGPGWELNGSYSTDQVHGTNTSYPFFAAVNAAWLNTAAP